MMLAKMPSAEIRLRKSGGGVFESTVDGKLAYSKMATGRGPTDEEVLGAVNYLDPLGARCLPRGGGDLLSAADQADNPAANASAGAVAVSA